MQPLTDLVVVAGAGRSGSTLLERIFDSSPNVVATGELHCLWRLPLSEITCSCGEQFLSCPFWQDVLQRARITDADLSELTHLETGVARTGFIASRRYDIETIRQASRVKRFLELQKRLLQAIREVSGSNIVIDSSKAGPRAWIMSSLPRTTVWHLRRHPGDVIASWRSRKYDRGLGRNMRRMSGSLAAVDWAKVEYLMRKLDGQANLQTLSYRELCRNPQRTCDDLARKSFGPRIVEPDWIDEKTFNPSAAYHSVNGNPDRFSSGPIEIRTVQPNREKLSAMDWYASRVLGAALSRVFQQRS